jgi:membrane-associated phospholipid phosphatase
MQASFLYKLKSFCIFAVVYFVFYVYPNFFGEHAVELPLWAIDRAVPFLPWTFIFYTSDYLLIFIAILMISELSRFQAYARMCFWVLIISGLFFFFYPTTYPRPSYPTDENWLVSLVMGLVGAADTPRNCFPSMHVALTAVATLGVRYKGPRVFSLFCLWSLAIFVSTLTTKQHYFADILGGVGVVALSAFLDRLLFQNGAWRSYLKTS